MTSADLENLVAPGIRELQPYVPGKSIDELEREYGISNALKLASNENPLGASPLAIKAAAQVLDGVNYYPDAYTLTEKLSTHLSVESDCLTIGNGSNDVLDMIARTFLTPDHNAVFSEHAFVVYHIATKAAGANTKVAAALPSDDPLMPYGHDLQSIFDLVDKHTRIVFIANPNNPTGTWLEKQALRDFVESLPRHVIVVLDEAYIEYALGTDFANGMDWLSSNPNLIVTRTFSKIYGLAGLRCGYGVSSPMIADYLNRVRHPFNVNNLAIVAAHAALDDNDFLKQSVAMNRAGLAQLSNAFEKMNLAYLPSAGNFITVDLGQPAGAIYEGLLREGVIVRPVANYNLPNHLRITISRQEENNQVIAALQKVVGKV